ncbi:hypothetical protein ETB55_19010 [Salmonella enterica subsp. enterica serovar Omuna]|nr:hypothetical protein [Salmonella enterica subsp. enterica serovar Omuna]
MKIKFNQIYAEVGANYSITNAVLNPFEDMLNSLNKKISHYEDLFKTDDYTIFFIISATTKNEDLVVKGPTTLSKKKKVEFVFFIPHKKYDSFKKEIFYIIDYIEKGIIFVFDKYKTDSSDIRGIVDKMKALISKEPEKYQQWIK